MKENIVNNPVSNAEKVLIDIMKKNNEKIVRKIKKLKKKQAQRYAK